MGIKGPDFVIVAADSCAVQQIITLKHDENKLVPIDSHKLMGISGEAGDRVQFSEYIIANTKLYALRNGLSLSTKAVANFARGEMAAALRRSPYYTNVLIAGFDEAEGPQLYWMDYLATMHSLNVAGTGYGSYFVYSMLDKLWRKDLTQEQALELMEKGIAEVKSRFVASPPTFQIKVVDKDGIRVLKEGV